MSSSQKLHFLALLAVVFFSNLAAAEENASNPLSAVNNLDVRWQHWSANPGKTSDFFADGAYMLLPNLKFKYELHFVSTDVTGKNRTDFESVVLKPIYFPSQTRLNENWGLRTAVGFELNLDFGNSHKGIGTGSHQLGPLVGLAFANTSTGLTLIPLLQHFTSIGGKTDINLTAMRLIALQPFGDGFWAKLDAKVPYDWENKDWPATAEAQLGYNINSSWALYADGLAGIGKSRPYDLGLGLGIRLKY